MFFRRFFLFALFAALMIGPTFAEQSGSGSGSGSGSASPSASSGSGSGSAGSGSASKSSSSGSGSASSPAGSGSGSSPGSAGSGSASTPAGSGSGVALKWKIEKDKPFYQRMKTETDQTLTITGNPIHQKQSQTFTYSWTLTETKENGDQIFKQKIEGLDMAIDIGTQRITFNSDSDLGSSNPLSDFLKNLVGAEFTVTLDKDFKVVKIEGKDKLVQKLGQASKPTEDLLNQILNDEAMKELADPTFSAIPNKTVEKGAKWERKSKFDMGPIGSYENLYTYTFEGEDNKKDKIKIEGEVKYTKPDDKKSGLPFKIKDAKIEPSKITGIAIYNPELGWVESVETNLNTKGELTVEISGQVTKVELEQKQTTKVNTTKDNPMSKGSGSAGSGSGSK